VRRRRQLTVEFVATLVFVLSLLTYGLGFPQQALAWDDCPLGMTNDPYPGACRRYVDTNNDGTCDHSQPQPAATTTTELAAPVAGTPTTAAAGEPPSGDCPLGPCLGCGACFLIPTVNSTSDSGSAAVGLVELSTLASDPDSGGSPLMTRYMVSPIAIGFFLIYFVSFVLYKTKRMRVTTHRKIWNVLLLATFLITGVFGLILAIQLDYELPFKFPFNLLFWHVEAGIVMTLISFFHLGWHLNYYRNLLRSRAGRSKEKQITAPTTQTDRALGAARVGSRPSEARSRLAQPTTPPESTVTYRPDPLESTD